MSDQSGRVSSAGQVRLSVEDDGRIRVAAVSRDGDGYAVRLTIEDATALRDALTVLIAPGRTPSPGGTP